MTKTIGIFHASLLVFTALVPGAADRYAAAGDGEEVRKAEALLACSDVERIAWTDSTSTCARDGSRC